MPLPKEIYEANIGSYNGKIKKLEQKIFTVAIFRLVVFVAFGVAAYFAFVKSDVLIILLALLFLTGFIVLVRTAFKLNDEKVLLQQLLFINTNERNILQNQPNEFSNGEVYLHNTTNHENYFLDLDIFGDRSIFHLLNRTTTSHGSQQLAIMLQNSFQSKNTIELQQHAVKELSPQLNERQLITAYGLLNKEKEGTLNDIISWLQSPGRLLSVKWIQIIRFVLPVINVGLLFYWLSTDNYLPMVMGIALSWIHIGFFGKYIKEQHSLIGKKQPILDQYSGILRAFTRVEASSPGLKELHNTALAADKSIQALSKLSGLIDQRLNLLVNFLLNSIFLYDIQCMLALEKWKAKNNSHFHHWIEVVGNIESFNSLAGFAFNNPGYCYPVVAEGALFIKTKQLAHPLIPAYESVPNDFSATGQNKLMLVTGSNMSGKTTFLRTLGVNLLLAQCGAPVCAVSFSFAPMQLLTSIRVSDSLQEHTSYFMAELKRLHYIIHQVQSGQAALVLIDEILRGTNSDDKTHGSEAFIRKLIKYNCLTLFATHDLALSKMENEHPGVIKNYCFESSIENGELLFDYKLREGVAKNKNASFLMEKMEII